MKISSSKIHFIVTLVVSSVFLTSNVLAHAVVKPSEVAPSAFASFTLGVPVEKEIPTTSVRLIIPEGLKHVTPIVKQGWKVEIIKSGTQDEATVKELVWSGGSIPAGFKDEFNFSAQVPAQGELAWKVYQTYSDKSVVAWDESPAVVSHEHSEKSGPYSKTTIVEPVSESKDVANGVFNPNFIGYAALLLATLSIVLQFSKRNNVKGS